MKALYFLGILLASATNIPNASAASSTVIANLYKSNVTTCSLEKESKPFDSKILAKNLVIKSDKRFTATVYQLDYSRLNDFSNNYYYRIKYNGKVVSNLIVSVINNIHPHGGPDGQNVGISGCGSNVKPIVKIGNETKKISGYIPSTFLTNIQQEFNWKNIIVSK